MPMQLPINTDGLTFIAAGYEPNLKDHRTGEMRIDRDTGQPVYSVHLMVFKLGDVRAQVWKVKVAGEPKGITQGHTVRVTNLVASDWERTDDKGTSHGISFRADSISPAVTSAKQAAA